MRYVITLLNIFLGAIITSSFYPLVGIMFVLFSGFMIIFGYRTAIGKLWVAMQIKNWGKTVDMAVFKDKQFLMSVACLAFSLKLGAAIAIFVETGAAVFIAFCILLACGYLFEQKISGGVIASSFSLARFGIKLFSLVSIGFDKIAEWIAKAEIRLLNIEI